MNREHRPKAIIPEHLVSIDIATMPLQIPYYIRTDGGMFDMPSAYRAGDGSLCVVETADINPLEDALPDDMTGRIGIMKVPIIVDGVVEERLIADLRFVEPGQLYVDDDDEPTDPEDVEDWLAFRAESRTVDAFIAREIGDTVDTPGIFYGPAEYHTYLRLLQVRGNIILGSHKRAGLLSRLSMQAVKSAVMNKVRSVKSANK